MINVFQPLLGKEEIEAIGRVFESNWIGKGKLVSQFEDEFSNHLMIRTDPKHFFSTNCCTEGLFDSMRIFHIGSKYGGSAEDEVILPTISFVGAGNAIRDAGAKMVLCDSDPYTLNVRASDIEKKLTDHTKAIILLHFGGIPCEMDEIMALAEEKHFKVIEDSACSVYSQYKGKACGTIGDFGTWSFDAMKELVCGDGGVYMSEMKIFSMKWTEFFTLD